MTGFKDSGLPEVDPTGSQCESLLKRRMEDLQPGKPFPAFGVKAESRAKVQGLCEGQQRGRALKRVENRASRTHFC